MANREDVGKNVGSALSSALTSVRNGALRLRNGIMAALPGERPAWLVVELSGAFPARLQKRKFMSVDAVLGKERQLSQQELQALVTALLAVDWLTGVVVRLNDLSPDWATAFAVRRQLERLKQGGKRLIITATYVRDVDYYIASVADEVVLPEGAELWANGTAVTVTYRADFLDRFGVKFQKLAIKEYKSAMDDLALSQMSDGQRQQMTALLDSFKQTFAQQVADSRQKPATQVAGWLDQGITSAAGALKVGMIDRVAYEDELLDQQHKPLAAGARYLPRPLASTAPKRVALVSLEGAIIPGKSRKSPFPLPLLGDSMAGSETVVSALRAAGKDERTAAVVFHVESGGGSPLASDLIWREIKLLAERLPVVAVMGGVAASGGYYVLTHATKVMAAPNTITGSIGVVSGKFVLQEFNAKYGFNPQTLKSGRYADLMTSARPYDDEERALVQRYMDEVYDRFVTRVAQGRGLAPERVNEIGRGRVWSGADAQQIGLVDELGDVAAAVALAKELAGLKQNAPVWNVQAPQRYVLPVGQDAAGALRFVAPLLSERGLLVMPFQLRVL